MESTELVKGYSGAEAAPNTLLSSIRMYSSDSRSVPPYTFPTEDQDVSRSSSLTAHDGS